MTDYASALDFIQQFGANLSADLVDRTDDNVLTGACLDASARATDVSSFEASNVASAVAGLALINLHLNDAKNTINSYLLARYVLPLPATTIASSSLKRLNADIARYFIASTADLSSEQTEMRYKDAVKWLKDVASGKAILIVDEQTSPTDALGAAGTKVVTGTAIDLSGY